MMEDTMMVPGVWKKFLQKHWRMLVVFVVAAVLVAVGVVLVYLWFVGQAQMNGIVPSSLALWTFGHIFAFVVNLIFWELVLVGIPVVIAAIVAYQLYKRLPADEREEYRRARLFRSRSRSRNTSGGFNFLITLAFLLKIYLDGNWNKPISSMSFDYLVYSFVTAVIAIAIIFGIPALVAGTWWMRRVLRT